MSKLSRVRRAALAAVVALPLSAALPASASVAQLPSDGGTSRSASGAAYGLGAGAVTPAETVASDRRRVRVGVEFSSKRAGRIAVVRFYRSTPDQRAYGVQLSTAGGKLLARGTATPSAAAGWRTAKLAQSVRIVPGRHYVASYVAPRGGYSATPNALSPTRPVRHKALTAWRGVFQAPSGSRVRASRSHYAVDVRFVPRPYRGHKPTKPATPTEPTTPVTPPVTPPTTPTTPPVTPPTTPTTPPTTPTTPTTPADPGNAGVPAGVVLKPSGSVTVNTDGAVVEGLNITGTLTINASNVTVRNTKVTSSAWWLVTVKNSAKNVRFEHVSVDGKGMSGTEGSSGIVGPGTYDSVEIQGVENGWVPSSGAVMTNSYIHGLNSPGAPHYDGVQIDGGVSDIRMTGTTVDMTNHTQTSAVMIDNYFGAVDNVVIDGNRLAGGGYTVYADGNFSTTKLITNVKYTNNKLVKGYYGYALMRGNKAGAVTFTGNVDATSGKAVNG